MGQRKRKTRDELLAEIAALEKRCAAFEAKAAGAPETEAALRESEARLRSMMAAMDDHVYICSADYRVEYMNPAMARRTGRHAVGEKCYEALHGRDRICPWCVNDIIQAGKGHKWQLTSPLDGRSYHVSNTPLLHADGRISKMAVIRDITDLKHTEQALRDSLTRFESVINSTPMVAVQGFDQSGRLRHWNPASEALYGYPASEAIGKTIQELLLSPAEAEEFTTKLAALWHSGTALAPQEWPIRTRAGETRWVYSTMFAVKQGGSVEEVFCMDVDVTARKRAEEDRAKLESQLQHTQKLESLGVLAGGIAHDFNNILMAILGHVDLALHELPPASPMLDNLQAVEKAACRAADLCRQMLAYSGKGTFAIAPVNLNEAIRELGHMLEVSISKKVAMRMNYDPDLPNIDADPSQVQQVIMNLVINASEAIGDQPGTITVTTGVLDCDRAYLSSAWLDDQLEADRYVALDVADTGCGMDRATQAKIFDPFFTTKFTGRGLGLAAVLGIVRGHKGALKVYSEPGRGTTFRVLLPTARNPGGPVAATPPAEPQVTWQGSGTILLVDDEECIRALGTRMLEVLGFQALTAADGREAIAVYKDHAPRIVGVILDLTMPNMDGEEAFRELRLLCPDLRVLMASGYNEQELTQQLLTGEHSGFIQKPYQLKTLRAKLRGLLT